MKTDVMTMRDGRRAVFRSRRFAEPGSRYEGGPSA